MYELLLEVGCEELPARHVEPMLEAFKTGLLGVLSGISYDSIHTYATPRRLAIAIQGLATHRLSVERVITGPAAEKAFQNGVPTQIGLAFAKARCADPSTLHTIQDPKRGAVAAIRMHEGGEHVVDLVSQHLESILTQAAVKKMTWGEGAYTFTRPIQRILAIYQGAVIPGMAFGIPFDNTTTGHRLLPESRSVSCVKDWIEFLRAHHVEPDHRVRRAQILNLLHQATMDLDSDPIQNESLLDEVVHIVECPSLVIGTFDKELLSLPEKLLVTSMQNHQRYFPVFRQGKLTNQFVVIANNPFADSKVVAEGNARVLRARFYDARFFLQEGRKRKLQDHPLDEMVWIRGLGTMADKVQRLMQLSQTLAPIFHADVESCKRAAQLSKCDIATSMVGEFPELQGHMGKIYALEQGESEEVALAIEEHYFPRNKQFPSTPVSKTLAICDRLDNLVGCFSIGLQPSSNGDPQGLRRSALGLVTLLAETPAINLEDLVVACNLLHKKNVVKEVVTFILARFKAWMSENIPTDLVEAVMAVQDVYDIHHIKEQILKLHALSQNPVFPLLLQTSKRVHHITQGMSYEDPMNLPQGIEMDVYLKAQDILSKEDVTDHLAEMALMVQDFFEQVLVMDPDETVRKRRLNLMHLVHQVFRRLADFQKISSC